RHHVLLFFHLISPHSPAHFTLSLHDALPICSGTRILAWPLFLMRAKDPRRTGIHACPTYGAERVLKPKRATSSRASRRASASAADRKSTRLNSSHVKISYAVFCLKKKN